MMKPVYHRGQILDLLNSYNNMPFEIKEFADNGISKPYPLSDELVDRFIKIYGDNTSRPVDYKTFIRSLTVYRDIFKNNGDTISLAIVNKLIGDRRIFKKAKQCFDGSYRANRIMGYVSARGIRFNIEITEDGDYGNKFTIESERDVRKAMHYLISNYETIFCQFTMRDTRSKLFTSLCNEIEFSRTMDEIDAEYMHDMGDYE